MIRLLSILLLLSPLSALADVRDDINANIPARIIPWYPGVRGGITNYPIQHWLTNSAGFPVADDGSVDCYAAITNLIARTTNGYALGISNGTYLVGTNITIPYTNHMVIRGQSATNTVLLLQGSNTQAHIIVNGNLGGTVTTVVSAAPYQSNIIVGSALGLVVGRYGMLLQTNDPAVVFGDLSSTTDPWQGQMFKITNISGTTITVDRPIYWTNYSSLLGLCFQQLSTTAEYFGIEDIKLTAKSYASTNIIQFNGVANSWMRNVTTTNAHNQHIKSFWIYACEFRDGRGENHAAYDSTSKYTFDLVRNTTDCLVENYICLGNNLGISFQQGSCGNVIGYSLLDNGFGSSFPSNQQTKGGINSHGDNCHYNLTEGNITPWVQWDNFWGESNREMAFRNWMRRQSFYNTTGSISDQGMAGLFIANTNYHMSAVGNIIGSPRDSGDPDLGISLAYNFRVGAQWTDPQVTNTMFLHMNYEFRDGSISSSNGYSQVLPASMYRTNGKPAWFGALNWPAIGPDVQWMTNSTATNFVVNPIIPAMARFMGADIAAGSEPSTAIIGRAVAQGRVIIR